MSELASRAKWRREDFDACTLTDSLGGCPEELMRLAEGKRNRTSPDIRAMAVLLGSMLNACHAERHASDVAENPVPESRDELQAMYGAAYEESNQFADYPARGQGELKQRISLRGGGVAFAAYFAGVSTEAARKWFDEIGGAVTAYAETEQSVFVEECWSLMYGTYEDIKNL